MDTFLVDVEYVTDDYTDAPQHTRVSVQTRNSTDAELTALEIVAADGRKPTRATVDWDNF